MLTCPKGDTGRECAVDFLSVSCVMYSKTIPRMQKRQGQSEAAVI